MKQKSRKQRQADQLGMPMGTARSKLQRKVIWHLLNRVGQDKCGHCGDWISSPEDLAITHVEQWLDIDPDLFWDTRNVAFMHPTCTEEYAADREAARRQKEQDKMNNLVSIGIVNERGDWLPGCIHEDKIYVAGKHGERYKITLRNHSNERVEVVLTVDGRDVITGKEGSKDERGYILHGLESYEIDGWRTSDDTVAAFRFGADKDKAYSTQKGSGASLGVIGMAVFQEKTYSRRTSVLRSSGIAPMGAPAGALFSMNASYGDGAERGAASASFTSDTVVTHTSTSTSTSRLDSFSTDRHLDKERETRAQAPGRTRGMRQMRRRKAGKEAPREEVKLGTKFGEEIQSQVNKVTFTRLGTTPAQLVSIEYDTFKNLKKRGIPVTRSAPRPTAPSGFPADDGYCKPPQR